MLNAIALSSFDAPPRWWVRLARWLVAPAPLQPLVEPLPHGVQDAADDFMHAVADLEGLDADDLRLMVQGARSLGELWHLRPNVYHLVSIQKREHEAGTRLDRLNRHFPTRGPRSGLAPLEP